MVFPAFGKCTGQVQIPPIYSLIPPLGIGITLKAGISHLSPIPPRVIPIVIIVNKLLIRLIYKAINQSVTNVAGIMLVIYPCWG